MNEPRIYDRQGQLITLEQWSKLLGDNSYKRVAWWEQGDIIVSTVWLGLEHHFSFGAEEPTFPVAIFETMVFGGSMDQEMWRYGTEEQALAGHAEVVTLVKSQLDLQGLTPAAEPPATTSTPGSPPLPATAQSAPARSRRRSDP